MHVYVYFVMLMLFDKNAKNQWNFATYVEGMTSTNPFLFAVLISAGREARYSMSEGAGISFFHSNEKSLGVDFIVPDRRSNVVVRHYLYEELD